MLTLYGSNQYTLVENDDKKPKICFRLKIILMPGTGCDLLRCLVLSDTAVVEIAGRSSLSLSIGFLRRFSASVDSASKVGRPSGPRCCAARLCI